MRGVQLAIVIMTALIFIGLGLLVYGVIREGAKLGAKNAIAAPVQELALPPSAKIEKISPWKEGLALHVTAPKGEYIYLVTPGGKIATTLVIKRSADAVPAAQ